MSETFEKKLSANPKTVAVYLHKLMQDWDEREVVELRFLAKSKSLKIAALKFLKSLRLPTAL